MLLKVMTDLSRSLRRRCNVLWPKAAGACAARGICRSRATQQRRRHGRVGHQHHPPCNNSAKSTAFSRKTESAHHLLSIFFLITLAFFVFNFIAHDQKLLELVHHGILVIMQRVEYVGQTPLQCIRHNTIHTFKKAHIRLTCNRKLDT